MTRKELRIAMRWMTEEREAFAARFPRLHRLPDGRARTYLGDIGRGWIPLLARIFELAEPDERAVLSQIKEKYGSLRVHFDSMGFNPELDRVVDEVELESETICEACGAPARQSETQTGWILTLCEMHLPEDARYLDDLPSPPCDP